MSREINLWKSFDLLRGSNLRPLAPSAGCLTARPPELTGCPVHTMHWFMVLSFGRKGFSWFGRNLWLVYHSIGMWLVYHSKGLWLVHHLQPQWKVGVVGNTITTPIPFIGCWNIPQPEAILPFHREKQYYHPTAQLPDLPYNVILTATWNNPRAADVLIYLWFICHPNKCIS